MVITIMVITIMVITIMVITIMVITIMAKNGLNRRGPESCRIWFQVQAGDYMLRGVELQESK
jgi:hypothetical protein